MIEVFDPTARPAGGQNATAKRPEGLRGRRLGLLDNSKSNADVLLRRIEQRLRDQIGMDEVVYGRKPGATLGASFLPEFARQADVVVNALGD
ncbi:MAG: hypothetical protein KGJ86_18005 [Chloroflexota bacterium]|nr:hypothetical protein [Chloroflexota bacterium]